MTDEIILLSIMGVMLAAAVGVLVPSLLRVLRCQDGDAPDGDAEYGRELAGALQEQLARLDEDRRSGAVTEAEYEDMLEDIRRRAVEEHRAVVFDPNAEPGRVRDGRVPGALIVSSVIAGMIAVSAGVYWLQGAPEVIRLLKDQTVIEGTAGIDALKVYLKDNSRDGRAWVLLARRYIEAENYAEAASAYREGRRVYTKVREDPEIMLELGATLLTLGTPEAFAEAQPVIQLARDRDPENMKAVELLAMAAAGNQDWSTAADQLSLLLRSMSPDTPEYLRYEQTVKMLRAKADTAQTESKR